jgi:MFS superfamily sulfate permease-like transporter
MVAGIIFSIIYLVYRVSFPARAELGRDEKTGDYEARTWITGTKQGEGNPDARPVPGVMLYRFDAPLEYSNSDSFKGTGEQIMIDAAAKGPLPKHMVIDFEEVFYTDASGASALRDLKNYAERYDVDLSIARLHSAAREVLERDGVLGELGEDHVYDSVHAAVAACTPPPPETVQPETAGVPT